MDERSETKFEGDKRVDSYGFGVRHVQVFLIFMCLMVGYMMRVNMSVAMVAMTEKNNSTSVETFEWSKQIQDIIFSSFFWGYTIMQIPAGQLSQRYGAKVLLCVAMFVNGFSCLITPLTAKIGGWKVLCALRTLQGLTQAALYPCIYTFISKWIPNQERSRLSNVVYSGSAIGTIVGMPLSSLLASTNIGWPLIFYTFGSLAILSGIIWLCFGANTPSTSKFITQEEKSYIEASLGKPPNNKKLKTPWKSILTSLPVISLILAHVGCNWGFLIFLVETPSYLKRVLGVDIKKSGLLSALPYTAMFFGAIALSFISDYIVNHKLVSVATSRKLFNTIGEWLPALGVIALGYVPPGQETISIILIILIVGCFSGMNMGYMMNHIDLSPNYSGSLVALTNCIANAVGVFAPITAGYILTDDTDPEKWRIVFLFTAGVYFFTNLFFLIFGSSDRQPWNELNVKNGISKIEKGDLENENIINAEAVGLINK